MTRRLINGITLDKEKVEEYANLKEELSCCYFIDYNNLVMVEIG